MNSTIFKYITYFLFLLLFVSCNNNEPVTPVTSNYIKVAEAISTNSSFKVEMYSHDSLFVGYNKLYFKITDNITGLSVTQATLALHPLMDMVTFKHACPVENPTGNLPTDGYYSGVIIFSMPGTNSWTVGVDVTANGKTETSLLNLSKVIATNPVQKIVVIDSVMNAGVLTQTKYPISLIMPSSWKVGINPFEITVNTMQDMMNFPVCDDLTVEITPEMPSMGHGSPNNVNPVSIGKGHYLGAVNFTMTGDWRIHLVIKKGTRIISSKAYFDIFF